MGCPHYDIRFCPLYVASHDGSGLGCDDGRLDEGTCAASRDVAYAEAVEHLRARQPRLVETLAFQEEAERLRQQRARTMRLAGLQ